MYVYVYVYIYVYIYIYIYIELISPTKCTNTNRKYKNFLFLSLVPHLESPSVGQGLLTVQALRSHSETPYSEGLLWTSDQPVAETSACKHTTPRQKPCPRGIRTCNSSQRAAADPRLRPRGRSFTVNQ